MKQKKNRRNRSPEIIPSFLELSTDFLERIKGGKCGVNRVVHYRGDFYQYRKSHYKKIENGDISAGIMKWLQRHPFSRELSLSRSVREVTANLQGLCHLKSSVETFSWIDGDNQSKNDAITVSNGILNISNFINDQGVQLLPPTSNFFSLSTLPVAFIPGTTSPVWDSFLQEALPDPAVRKLIQEWFGYNLVRWTKFEKFIILEGEGANGKTVICAVLRALLGDENVSAVSLESFDPIRTFALAGMLGKLANIVEEIGEIETVAEGILKQIVTGGAITLEQKYRDPFITALFARQTFATNILPKFTDRSEGLWRRMLLVPFRSQILDEAKQNKNLINVRWWRESGELSGVLNWALDGLKRLQLNGRFTEPMTCVEFKSQFRAESNPARVFLSENFESADQVQAVSSSEVYRTYRDWAQAHGYRPLGAGNFAKEVKKTFPKVTITSNPRYQKDGTRSREWVGLRMSSKH